MVSNSSFSAANHRVSIKLDEVHPQPRWVVKSSRMVGTWKMLGHIPIWFSKHGGFRLCVTHSLPSNCSDHGQIESSVQSPDGFLTLPRHEYLGDDVTMGYSVLAYWVWTAEYGVALVSYGRRGNLTLCHDWISNPERSFVKDQEQRSSESSWMTCISAAQHGFDESMIP